MVTVNEIAKEMRVPVSRVEYALRSRGIRPISRVGYVRIFSDETRETLRPALQDSIVREMKRQTKMMG